jgi:hypothetical protein
VIWVITAISLWLAFVAIKVAVRRRKSREFVRNALKPGAGLEQR